MLIQFFWYLSFDTLSFLCRSNYKRISQFFHSTESISECSWNLPEVCNHIRVLLTLCVRFFYHCNVRNKRENSKWQTKKDDERWANRKKAKKEKFHCRTFNIQKRKTRKKFSFNVSIWRGWKKGFQIFDFLFLFDAPCFPTQTTISLWTTTKIKRPNNIKVETGLIKVEW